MFKGPSTRRIKDAGLTQVSFDNLLSCLGRDRESAADQYVELWHGLFSYFVVRGAEAPNLLTDETFDRVAHKLTEGTSIFTARPANYFYGVARNVWRESLAKATTTVQLTDGPEPQRFSLRTPDHVLLLKSVETAVSEGRLACLEKCLTQLPREDRDLIVGYYHDTGGAKIERRAALASQLGVSLDSLRHRVARLRTKLGPCIEQCMRPPSRSRLDQPDSRQPIR